VQNIPRTDIKRSNPFFFIRQFLLPVLSYLLFTLNINAQDCPPNIDFETGTFDSWTCYTGSVSANGGQNTISLFPTGGPVFNQHTMYSANQSAEVDRFGGFPVNCPNGSGHSIRLGNETGGGQAEGISYEFTIPSNQNNYSLVYQYAVVFQDPNHQEFQQPRLEIEVTDVTDNETIYCSSFTFFPIGSLLPGFFVSPIRVDTTDIWCKNWSAVTINMNGKAGKTIRLFFKTADCTFTRHFGYAYIDINSECSSEFVGASYCPDDTAINLTAPYGYQNYTWYDSSFTQLLGSQQSLYLAPPPPPGTYLAVEIAPYNGYGCLDTLYALLIDTLTVVANAGKDTLSCNGSTVPIGTNSRSGFVYRWNPAAGLSNPAIANPRAGPLINTTYVLTARSLGGGCVSIDSVVVTASVIDTALALIGKPAYCITSGDSAVLVVQPTNHIQWYNSTKAISGATFKNYKVPQSGFYHALLTNGKGCSINTAEREIVIEIPRPGITYPIKNAVIDYPIPLQARDFGITVVWKPSIYLDNPLSFTPRFNGPVEKLYSIDITTRGGCTTVDTQLVKVFEKIKFYVPTAFTPNNDGLNDYLKPTQAGIKEFRYFRIYHRWGQLLFDLNANPRGWDGKINGIPQPTQVVVWMAEGIGYDNKVYRQKGSCVLIR
jgi:gliding motility-associated-like protein